VHWIVLCILVPYEQNRAAYILKMMDAHRLRLRFLSQEAMTDVTAGGSGKRKLKVCRMLECAIPPCRARLQSASPEGREGFTVRSSISAELNVHHVSSQVNK
jgi:hypothetical protein